MAIILNWIPVPFGAPYRSGVAAMKYVNTTAAQLAGITEITQRNVIISSKVASGVVSTGGIAVGTKQLLVAVTCGDRVCATISAIGVGFDCVNFCCVFVPGAQYAQVIFTPLSFGCKCFVQLCQTGNLPWQSLCR